MISPANRRLVIGECASDNIIREDYVSSRCQSPETINATVICGSMKFNAPHWFSFGVAYHHHGDNCAWHRLCLWVCDAASNHAAFNHDDRNVVAVALNDGTLGRVSCRL